MKCILLAIIAGIALEFLLYKIQDTTDSIFAVIFVFAWGVLVAISIVVYIYAGFCWFAAEHKANIINREYGTSYTAQEVFWAEEVIETIRQIDRQRYELNGNLLNSQKE